jgi:chromosome segregation ATPase
VNGCCDVLVQLKRKELMRLETEVESRAKMLGSLEADGASLQHSINSTLYDKQRGLEKLASVQRMTARFESVLAGRRPTLSADEEDGAYEQRQQVAAEQERIRQLIEGLAEAHPGLSEVLNRVSQLIDASV